MNRLTPALLTWLAAACFLHAAEPGSSHPQVPLQNRAPLQLRPFLDLPLGVIEPRGWLRLQLERQRDGMTGHLDERYEAIVGPRNGWLGGDGDGWERGPYWLDGLVPLGYLLNDESLLAKARPWIEWTLTHQEPNGYLGPKRFDKEPKPEAGIQKTPREDWWPRMVMLKVLQQHHGATGDERVVEVLRRYFKYQLQELEKTPLDHWSFWANRRGGDNSMVVYWLYNLTGDAFLLELGELLARQTFPYTEVFLNESPEPSPDLAHLYPYNTGNRFPFNRDLIRRLSVDQLQSFHCVNLAQGIKQPVVWSQQDPDERHLRAVKSAFADIRRFHGQPQGMYGGDEPMHGNDPTQGIEFCSVVEMMFSLETMVGISGDLDFADHLEWIAYNALPTQSTPDFKYRQYLQSANQVLASRARRNFYEEDWHQGTDLCFGLLTGYPCCTCNMHQGWPKWVQHLWRATPDGGLAALAYGPSAVAWKVGDGVPVRIEEETRYPFEETVRFRVTPDRPVTFPLQLRVPGWARGVTLRINGRETPAPAPDRLLTLKQEWKAGDVVEVAFAADVRISRWHENAVALERGPLVYSLRIEEDWRWIENTDKYGDYYEVHPKSPWNFALVEEDVNRPADRIRLERRDPDDAYPWSLAGVPLELRVHGKQHPQWQMYGFRAGPLPHSRPQQHLSNQSSQELVLVPYGCTRLRITEFPVVK